MVTASNIFGSSKGTLGNIITQNSHGRQILKAREIHRNDSQSPAQNSQRLKYLFACNFLRQISPALSVLYPSRKVKMSPFSFSLSHILKYCLSINDTEVFFSNHLIFRDLIEISDHPDFSCSFDDSTLQFSFFFEITNTKLFDRFQLSDTLLLFAFNPSSFTIAFKLQPIQANNFSFTLVLPDTAPEDEIYFLITSLQSIKTRPGHNFIILPFSNTQKEPDTKPTFDSTLITFDSTLFTFDNN